MKKTLITLTILLMSGICFGQSKSKLSTLKQVQEYNKQQELIKKVTKINSANQLKGTVTLSVDELNEILRELDSKIMPGEHKLLTKKIQEAINKKQK